MPPEWGTASKPAIIGRGNNVSSSPRSNQAECSTHSDKPPHASIVAYVRHLICLQLHNTIITSHRCEYILVTFCASHSSRRFSGRNVFQSPKRFLLFSVLLSPRSRWWLVNVRIRVYGRLQVQVQRVLKMLAFSAFILTRLWCFDFAWKARKGE